MTSFHRARTLKVKRRRVQPCFDVLEDRILLTGTAIWPVAETANDHQMLSGFGDAEPAQGHKFHGGIDIYLNGQGSQPGNLQVVRAARTGVLVRLVNLGAGAVQNWFMNLRVDVGGGSFEYDRYSHVMNVVPAVMAFLTPGAPPITVNQGAPLGEISNTAYPAGQRHLHFGVQSAPMPDFGPDYNTYLNPFQRFNTAADKENKKVSGPFSA